MLIENINEIPCFVFTDPDLDYEWRKGTGVPHKVDAACADKVWCDKEKIEEFDLIMAGVESLYDVLVVAIERGYPVKGVEALDNMLSADDIEARKSNLLNALSYHPVEDNMPLNPIYDQVDEYERLLSTGYKWFECDEDGIRRVPEDSLRLSYWEAKDECVRFFCQQYLPAA